MKNRGVLLFAAILALLSITTTIILPAKAETPTTLTINQDSIKPYLVKPIPNFTWSINNNLTNAFNINDYFKEDAGNPLNFTFDSVSNILIVIDNTTGMVSFYPTFGFLGSRITTFHVSNGINNVSSNPVTLTLTNDTEAPKWSNPVKSKLNIYQNDFINLSALWTDNVELYQFFLSIDQGTGWVNYTPVSFSGISNISLQKIQISAGGGVVVSWKFYARDTSGNINETDVQQFIVSTLPEPPTSPPDSGNTPGDAEEVGGGATVTPEAQQTKVDFLLDPETLKMTLKQGESITRFIKIRNLGIGAIFSIKVNEGNEFATILSRKLLNISSGETATLAVEFKTLKQTLPDLYLGTIEITAKGLTKKIPFAIQVKPLEIAFDIDVALDGKMVRPGEVIAANITFTNQKDEAAKNFTLYYAIKDWEGNIISSETEQQTSSRKVSFERSLLVPATTSPGSYFFYARASMDNLDNIDAELFDVGEFFLSPPFIKRSLLWLLIVIIVVIILIFIIKYRRNKERARLLSLYMLTRELKEAAKQGKTEDALNIYIKIKGIYGEKASDAILENKEQLKSEIDAWLKTKGNEIQPPPSAENKKEEKKDEAAKGEPEKKEEPKKEENKENVNKSEKNDEVVKGEPENKKEEKEVKTKKNKGKKTLENKDDSKKI